MGHSCMPQLDLSLQFVTTVAVSPYAVELRQIPNPFGGTLSQNRFENCGQSGHFGEGSKWQLEDTPESKSKKRKGGWTKVNGRN